ncbi:MAG: response regulator transcription factor [Bacteroidota bacterium]
MQKVLLAEDHGIVIKAIQIIFETDFRNYTLATVRNSKDLLQAVQQEDYALVIIDLELEDGNIVPLIHELLTLNPGLPVLIFSGKPEELYAQPLYANGIMGYLSKQAGDTEVMEALRTALTGKLYVSEKMAAMMTNGPAKTSGTHPFENLSPQEMQVALLMQQGKKPSEICRELSLQSSTVATYKMKIFTKLNISNVIELNQIFINYQAT